MWIDKQPGVYYTGDLADGKTLERFAAQVIADYGHIDYLINNALPLMKGIDSCTWQEFNYARLRWAFLRLLSVKAVPAVF